MFFQIGRDKLFLGEEKIIDEKSNRVRNCYGYLIRGDIPCTWSEPSLGEENSITLQIGGSESRRELSPASLFGVLGVIDLSRVLLPPGKRALVKRWLWGTQSRQRSLKEPWFSTALERLRLQSSRPDKALWIERQDAAEDAGLVCSTRNYMGTQAPK